MCRDPGNGMGFPYLPFDEPVDHAAVLIETPHLEGLVQRLIDSHAFTDSHLCVCVCIQREVGGGGLQYPIGTLANLFLPSAVGVPHPLSPL